MVLPSSSSSSSRQGPLVQRAFVPRAGIHSVGSAPAPFAAAAPSFSPNNANAFAASLKRTRNEELVAAMSVETEADTINALLNAQFNADPYYAGIDTNLKGRALQAQLTTLISKANTISYDALWNAFKVTDSEVPGGTCPASNKQGINDIYSTKCWTPGTSQCGAYKAEGDCYNREHTWPKSAWGGDVNKAYSDLFHLYPADGYDNNRRSSYWYGEVSTPSYTTNNGNKLGTCKPITGESVPSTCWEPIDQYKGVLARGLLYMETRYYNSFTCCNTEGTINAILKPWLRKTLVAWHKKFPVSAAEIRRNDIIYNKYQQNRNPFIDHPEWVGQIYDHVTA
eukprot:m.102192 g.102192  ORF g.102192 m.102192 type:complete len:339 (-) comp8816_c1_seq2:6-1022(-)